MSSFAEGLLKGRRTAVPSYGLVMASGHGDLCNVIFSFSNICGLAAADFSGSLSLSKREGGAIMT